MEPHTAERQHGATNGSNGSDTPVIYVNFGLKWRHIAGAITALVAAVGGLGTAGWLVLPAKQSDMTRVERGLEEVRGAVEVLGRQNLEIITVIKDLRTAVDRPAPPPRVMVKKAKPLPIPPVDEKPKNIFGF